MPSTLTIVAYPSPLQSTQQHMGKKNKKDKPDDDWEKDADAIAQENITSPDPGVALEEMFSKLISQGLASEADYDHATDLLASGTKTEQELMTAWQTKTSKSKDASDNRPEQEALNDCDKASSNETADEVESGSTNEGAGKAGRMTRSEPMSESELRLDEWRRAGSIDPKVLPLSGVSGVCLFGEYGMSTHGDRMVRLWDATSGRRLGAHQHKLELSACAASGELVVVGDGGGGLHLYSTTSDFVPLRLAPSHERSRAVSSIALLPRGGGAVVVAASGGEALSVLQLSCDRWPPAQPRRASLALPPLDGWEGGVHLAAGPQGTCFGASSTTVAMLDLEKGLAAWESEAVELGESAVGWRGEWCTSDDGGALIDGFSSAAAQSHAPLKVAAHETPSRPLSYSPFWKLVAASVVEGVVGLWDVRMKSERRPAAGVRVHGGAMWVHLDEGQGMAGHLLVAPSAGGAILLYDVRRLSAAREPSAVRAVVSFGVPPSSSSTCFAAQGCALVVGGGAACGEVWRYCGREEIVEEEESQQPRPTPPSRNKPKRVVSTNGRRMFNRTK